MSKIQELQKKLKEAKDEMKKHGKSALKEVFSDFFKEHPYIKEIVWEQYTPWFNDGDACTFSISDPNYKADMSKLDDDDAVKKLFVNNKDYDNEENIIENYDELFDNESPEDFCYCHAVYEIKKPTDQQKKFKKDSKELRNIFLMDDLFLSVFGDHAKITATKNGFEIERLDHD